MANDGLVAVDDALKVAAGLVGLAWPSARRIGLFRNARPLDRHTLMEDLEPCLFSGYAGLQALPPLAQIGFDGSYYVVAGDPVMWTCDGGSPGDYVAGYYVVDADGTLLWAELRPGGPLAMTLAGQQYTVIPRISVGTRYGGET